MTTDCRNSPCIWQSHNEKKALRWCDKHHKPLAQCIYDMNFEGWVCDRWKLKMPERTVKIQNHLVEPGQQELL